MTPDKNEKRKYTIEQYNPEWVAKFESIKQLLQRVFGDKSVVIEHIGSTAILGMKAKPLIDVLVAVDHIESFENEKQMMIEEGYQWGENYIAPNTLIFYKTGEDNQKLVNIHVCEKDSFKADQFITERDFLRTHPEWVKKYSDHKEMLNAKFPGDYVAYREGKKAFFEELEKAVIEWRRS